MTEYLCIDSSGCLFKDSLRTLIAVWIDVSKRRREAVRLNRSARPRTAVSTCLSIKPPPSVQYKNPVLLHMRDTGIVV